MAVSSTDTTSSLRTGCGTSGEEKHRRQGVGDFLLSWRLDRGQQIIDTQGRHPGIGGRRRPGDPDGSPSFVFGSGNSHTPLMQTREPGLIQHVDLYRGMHQLAGYGVQTVIYLNTKIALLVSW